MSKKETAKRYILFIISLFFSAVGVALAKHSSLGVTPISSVANIMSIRFDSISMGTWLTIWNCLLLVGQIIVLRRDFKLVQLLQIPLSFLFGYFTDFGMWLVSAIPNDIYIARLALVLSGIIVLGFGIALSVIANVIMNSGEAFVKAVSDKSRRDFGNVKIALDVTYVLCAIVLSLVFFDMKIVGTREGTVISAVCTGLAVKLFRQPLTKPVTRLLTDNK